MKFVKGYLLRKFELAVSEFVLNSDFAFNLHSRDPCACRKNTVNLEFENTQRLTCKFFGV